LITAEYELNDNCAPSQLVIKDRDDVDITDQIDARGLESIRRSAKRNCIKTNTNLSEDQVNKALLTLDDELPLSNSVDAYRSGKMLIGERGSIEQLTHMFEVLGSVKIEETLENTPSNVFVSTGDGVIKVASAGDFLNLWEQTVNGLNTQQQVTIGGVVPQFFSKLDVHGVLMTRAIGAYNNNLEFLISDNPNNLFLLAMKITLQGVKIDFLPQTQNQTQVVVTEGDGYLKYVDSSVFAKLTDSEIAGFGYIKQKLSEQEIIDFGFIKVAALQWLEDANGNLTRNNDVNISGRLQVSHNNSKRVYLAADPNINGAILEADGHLTLSADGGDIGVANRSTSVMLFKVDGTQWMSLDRFGNLVVVGDLFVGNIVADDIDATGDVNISGNLDVLGNANLRGTDNTTHFYFGANEDTYIRGGKAASKIIIGDINTGDITIAKGGGDLGVGIDPTQKLDVNGNAKVRGLIYQEADNPLIALIDNLRPNGQKGLRLAFNNGVFVFQRASDTGGFQANYLAIKQSNGYMGWGTITPTEALHIKNGNAKIEGVTDSVFTNIFGDNRRLMFPRGASFLGSGNQTGAIKITLPVSWNNTLMKFKVVLNGYIPNKTAEISISGYNWTSQGGKWVACEATTTTSVDGFNPTISFGHDGTNCVVYIGDLTETWSFVKASVMDCHLTHAGGDLVAWLNDWSMSLETTFENISATVTDNLPIAKNGSKWVEDANSDISRSSNVDIQGDLFVDDIVADDVDVLGGLTATGIANFLSSIFVTGAVVGGTLNLTGLGTDTAPTKILSIDASNNVKETPIASLISTSSYVYQRRADQELNNVAWTKLDFHTKIGSLVTLTNGSDVEVLNAALYNVTFAAQLTSTGQRSSVECAIFIDGVQLSPSAFSYIRNVNGLNKDSVQVHYKGFISANAIVTVQFRRHGTITASCTLANLPTNGTSGSINQGRANCQLDILRIG
jgi:hypothetical protein